MKEFWSELTTAQKTKYIISGIAAILGLIFAIMNWNSVNVHLVFTSISIPITVLIVLSMAAGYGLATLFDYKKFRGKDKEIKSLKSQISSKISDDDI